MDSVVNAHQFQPEPFTIVVIGDVSLEDIYAPIPGDAHQISSAGHSRETASTYRRYRRRGGAWLLHEMIEAATTTEKLKENVAAKIVTYPFKESSVLDAQIEATISQPYRNSAAILDLYSRKSASAGLQDRVYRAKELLGWVDNHTSFELYPQYKAETPAELPRKEANHRSVVAVVAIGESVHFRIFDKNGEIIVDTDANLLLAQLEASHQAAERERIHELVQRLRALLNELSNAVTPSESQKRQIISLTMSITSSARKPISEKNPLEDRFTGDPELEKSIREANIIVLHDANGDFRRLNGDVIDKHLVQPLKQNSHFKGDPEQTSGLIVWHMYTPLAEGTLWTRIAAEPALLDRTILVVKAECLRQAGMNLADGISLETESHNFLTSIERINRLRQLVRARHLVVHFHRLGVMHYDRKHGLKYSCYFCPYMKDDAASGNFGMMVGYTSILVASLVRGLTWHLRIGNPRPENSNIVLGIVDGLKQGVILDHRHFLNGFANAQFYKEPDQYPRPYKRLFDEIEAAFKDGKDRPDDDWSSYRLAVLRLPEGPAILSRWSRIEGLIERRRELQRQRNERRGRASDEAEDVAREIVQFGLEQVVDPEPGGHEQPGGPELTPGTPIRMIHCPYEVRGKIKTAYRNEIDSFSSIWRIMRKYRDNEQWKHPLSIAVFGPPGSGKSFTIKQILEDVDPEIAKRPLEYNLAQFTGVQNLETAFHQVQDRSLAHELPLVVFDEFDSNLGTDRLGWLKYFLAPMQDGKFKAGESMYGIGRAIFVFSGGIAKSFAEFYDNQKREDYFKAAKGPDFVSRLRGHLNILGINAGKEETPTGREEDDHQEGISSVLIFRRAVLLRSLLEEHLKSIIDENADVARIDPGVIRAFLLVKRYEHGARSMQAIIEMARPSHRGFFLKSSLPSAAQLNMHVDADEFLDLVNRRSADGSQEYWAAPD